MLSPKYEFYVHFWVCSHRSLMSQPLLALWLVTLVLGAVLLLSALHFHPPQPVLDDVRAAASNRSGCVLHCAHRFGPTGTSSMTASRCPHHSRRIGTEIQFICDALKHRLQLGTLCCTFSLTHFAQSWLDLLGVDNAHARIRAQPL
jgi:hypothetical protein